MLFIEEISSNHSQKQGTKIEKQKKKNKCITIRKFNWFKCAAEDTKPIRHSK